MENQQDERYIIFERTGGHCHITLVRAPSCADAMRVFAVNQLRAKPLPDGSLQIGTEIYHHPLDLIESYCKADPEFDELEQHLDHFDWLLNPNSWEIRRLPTRALEAEIAGVFCTAEPSSISGNIAQCRKRLVVDDPALAQARAFVWYTSTGPMVSFHTSDSGRPVVRARYFELHSGGIEKWDGSFDELLGILSLDYPFDPI